MSKLPRILVPVLWVLYTIVTWTVFALAFQACDNDNKHGTINHLCYDNGTCNEGLTCIAWSHYFRNEGKWNTWFSYTPSDLTGLEETRESICADTKTMKISDIRNAK